MLLPSRQMRRTKSSRPYSLVTQRTFLHGVLLIIIPLSLSACSPTKKDRIDAYFCAPASAYTDTGAPDVTSYQVKKDCLRGLQKRIAACYQPQ